MQIKPIFSSAVLLLFLTCCGQETSNNTAESDPSPTEKTIVLGAANFDEYLPALKQKNVAVVVNQTSIIGSTHLVDTLLSRGVNLVKIFSPEHGFRGEAADGEKVDYTADQETGVSLVSLYGKTRKPTREMLEDVDVIIFDIQDVGARFYTYISTMHYIMEACAEYDKKFIVLDRPNPNGDYVDGPVLDLKFRTFVGMHQIPIVHGLTVGELAEMINGEGWLENGARCDLTVIKCREYHHQKPYSLPIRTSPNLPNDQAARLYPTLCLFEGTAMSIGRGTPFPFQAIGYPNEIYGSFTFTPKSIEGVSKYPKLENERCFGVDLRDKKDNLKFSLSYLIDFYHKFPEKEKFFIKSFTRLAGNDKLQQQIIAGLSEEEIRQTWEEDLNRYKEIRKKYLLYPEN
ncbi:DUF1343 domain-containing protein [Fulvivirgaceae bacterium BMA12]|uniref:DUF1343 domain-containing protein n=1 Tax=Agaribacillus aureus TaxID=3051825 RepID=A0ABT8L1K7_9BACT|nr:DUF1343 domain-containing protein [Fulvivirgaceae bacterium BMA12]